MIEQVEAYQTAGGIFWVWKLDNKGFSENLYSGKTIEQAIENAKYSIIGERNIDVFRPLITTNRRGLK